MLAHLQAQAQAVVHLLLHIQGRPCAARRPRHRKPRDHRRESAQPRTVRREAASRARLRLNHEADARPVHAQAQGSAGNVALHDGRDAPAWDEGILAPGRHNEPEGDGTRPQQPRRTMRLEVAQNRQWGTPVPPMPQVALFVQERQQEYGAGFPWADYFVGNHLILSQLNNRPFEYSACTKR